MCAPDVSDAKNKVVELLCCVLPRLLLHHHRHHAVQPTHSLHAAITLGSSTNAQATDTYDMGNLHIQTDAQGSVQAVGM